MLLIVWYVASSVRYPLSAVNASPTCISSQGDLVSAVLPSECNLWRKHNWFALTNFVICYYAGVSWVEVQSSNHGSPVTKDQRGECGEDHAIWALHHGVWCLPCHQGEGPWGTAWPAWVFFLSFSLSFFLCSLALCFSSIVEWAAPENVRCTLAFVHLIIRLLKSATLFNHLSIRMYCTTVYQLMCMQSSTFLQQFQQTLCALLVPTCKSFHILSQWSLFQPWSHMVQGHKHTY